MSRRVFSEKIDCREKTHPDGRWSHPTRRGLRQNKQEKGGQSSECYCALTLLPETELANTSSFASVSDVYKQDTEKVEAVCTVGEAALLALDTKNLWRHSEVLRIELL